MIDIKVTPNKNTDKNTTSHKFKQDLVEFFYGKELDSCLEIGTNRGYSTLILSQLFGWVTTIEIDSKNIEVVLVGQYLNLEYISQLEEKIEKLIKRKVSFYLASKFLSDKPHIVIFSKDEK